MTPQALLMLPTHITRTGAGPRRNRRPGLGGRAALINLGNLGGPLLDEKGRVHGVNTLILRNTQGIGFAIPIKAVFDDFNLTTP